MAKLESKHAVPEDRQGNTKKISSNLHKKKPFTIVAIGASVGGLEAISEFLKKIPADTGMAYIYVQHLSPDHKSFLTTILSKITGMKVQEIEDMELMEPNNVYVIPHNKIIEVTNGHIQLLPRAKNASSITIDILFSSLAETHKQNVIGIILSGNGSDGTIGVKAIKYAGGLTFAQDSSAQAQSMPQTAIQSGMIDFVLSPEQIALKLVYLKESGFFKVYSSRKAALEPVETNSNDLNTIFELLLKKTGVDFSHYKQPTIKRRISHKMRQCGVKTISEYVRFLEKKNSEIEILYNDLLINVTSFFRETISFQYLKTTLFPKLLKSKAVDDILRIWVPACSKGEEAYSIAMIICELQTHKVKKIQVQIFATDLSEQMIRDARIGSYSKEDVKSIPENYLTRFFTKTGDGFSVVKELREMCVFAPHNILRDPPFSRMDFISCCNLLIYFDTAAQKKVFTSIHFALNENGYLMLGKAETIGSSSQLFSRINNKYKIYSRKQNTGTQKILELTPRFPRNNMSIKKISPISKSNFSNQSDLEDAIDSILLASYMPACAVVNKELEILQFRGPVSLFLEHASGKASLNILKMTRPEFSFELRNAIHSVLKTKETVYKTGIEIKVEQELRTMSFEVSPLNIVWDEPLLIIVFKLYEKQENFNETTVGGNELKDLKIKKLSAELHAIRKEMNAIIDAQELTYEELQAANEEIVSSNEEFQTLNEELETSKEEIEASNEELISTNQEMQLRNDLLTEEQDYSEAIIATIHEPMLILDKHLHVKSANKAFYKKFLVKKAETEGKLLHNLGNKQWNIPKLNEMLKGVVEKGIAFEQFEVKHHFSGIGERIMLLNAHPIIQKAHCEQLILFAIEDITNQSQIFLKEKYSLSLIEASLDPLVTINPEGKITDMNQATVNITGIPRQKLKDTNFLSYFTEPQKAQDVYEEVFARGSVKDFPLTIRHKAGKLTPVLFNGSVYKDELGAVIGIVVVARDVTEQKRITNELQQANVNAELAIKIAEQAKIKAENATLIAEESLRSKQQFLSNMSHEIRTPLNAIIGFTKVMLKTHLTTKQLEFLSAIKVSSDALIVLINDILDLAKVDAGKMVFEQKPFKLFNSISSILHLFEPKIQEMNLILEKKYDHNIPEILLGDAARLNQILLNLVSNAIKFTNMGKINVEVRLIKENEKCVSLEFNVSDTGIGISSKKLKYIFENFQQATDDTSRLYGGTGLGLAIVKQLVELQGGTIRVKSKVDQGSSFKFCLDFQKTIVKENLVSDDYERDPENRNIKVLVVEDIPLNQLLMKTLLDDFGFEQDIAPNGKIAIEMFGKKSYDIVLMDLQMPEMNGFEATKHIRTKLNSKIPIIALTADVTTVDLAKCKAVGMNDYISKPVEEQDLYNKIIGLVKKTPMKQELETKKQNVFNLEYIANITKANPSLVLEMIQVYLKQTPAIIGTMKQSLATKDWELLQASAHKLIPSFSIMGIAPHYENMARKITDYTTDKTHYEKIPGLVLQLEKICMQACTELIIEADLIKKGGL